MLNLRSMQPISRARVASTRWFQHGLASNVQPRRATSSKRTPTNEAFYDFNGVPCDDKDPNSLTWMYAKDAKAQQAGLAPGHQSGRVYPSAFNNKEKLALSTPGSALKPNGPRQWLHSPLVPGTTETWTPASTEKSGVRSVYTADDPSKFDVVYHDNRAGASGKKGFGKFVKAEYHPAVEEKDRD